MQEQPATSRLEAAGFRSEPDAATELRKLCRLRVGDLGSIFWQVSVDWSKHKVPRLAAALAFYSMLSMAPLIVVVLAVAGLAYGREAAEGRLVWEIQNLVGWPGAEVLQRVIGSARSPLSGGIAAAVGLLTLFLGATGVVAELRSAMNTIWEIPEHDGNLWRGVVDFWKDRAVAFLAVLGLGFLLLVSLLFHAALALAGAFLAGQLPAGEWLWQTLNVVISLFVMAGLFALLYKYLPEIHIAWTDVLPGAILTALLFTGGKLLIGLYLGKAAVASAYGAAGSLAIFLLWIYYSAQIFFLGAEFTQVYANRYGSRPRERHERARHLKLAMLEQQRALS
jgi:membrane protein